MKKTFKILQKWYVLIGIVIFIFILRGINFADLKKVILDINPYYYLLAAISYIPITYIKAYRWKKVMDTQNIHYSAKEAFYMHGSSSLFGLITPGRLGDFSKIAYLKRDNHSFVRAFLGSFLDKIFDILFVAIFIVSSLPFLKFPFHFYFNYAKLLKYGALAVVLGIIILTFLYYRFEKHKEKIKSTAREVWDDLKKFNLKNTLIILSVTAVTWFGYFVMVYLIAMSIGLNQSVGFLYMAFSAAFGIISALIPISILGVGTRELSLLALLVPLGIPKAVIVIFSLLITANYIPLTLIYFYCYLKKPLFAKEG